MKRITLLLCLLILAGAVCCASASAASSTYDFDDIHARLTLDSSGYDMVLTPATLESHQDWLTSHGEDLEQTKIRYEKLKAFCNKIEAAGIVSRPAPNHDCPLWMLRDQQKEMGNYLNTLEIRAEIEGVEL